MNAATQKTLAKIKAAAAKATDGWADLSRFDIRHVSRLERAGLVKTDTAGAAVRAPGFRWHVQPR